MKIQKIVMGMPSNIEIVDKNINEKDFYKVFSYFNQIDEKFSTYKENSEISKINRNEIKEIKYSSEMKKILKLSKQTKNETNGYFNININGKIDPSGIVKGYAIYNGAKLLLDLGYKNFYVEIAGDIQVFGKNINNKNWKIGIENPFKKGEIIKVINLSDKGIATSGNYIRGKHIYNPKKKLAADEIMSLSVIGPNVYEADRFATAAFAMGKNGIKFIENLSGFEGYMVTKDKNAIFTSNFEKYLS